MTGRYDREALLLDVANAWVDLSAADKVALMQTYPDLYWPLARLTATCRVRLDLD